MVIENPLLKVLLLTIQDLILLHLLGCNIVSLFSGIVTFTGFSGAGGYTITIQSLEFTASYCHVSPNFKVFVGQSVKKGSIIGKVGPKNVYGVPNNPYKDKNGNPTNGATTGPHLHLTLKKNRQISKSFRLFLIYMSSSSVVFSSLSSFISS